MQLPRKQPGRNARSVGSKPTLSYRCSGESLNIAAVGVTNGYTNGMRWRGDGVTGQASGQEGS